MVVQSRAAVEVANLRLRTAHALSLGIFVAIVAFGLRLLLSQDVGGEQAIFSFPAIVIATLLFGGRAGTVTASLCLIALWYFVVPPHHSFTINSPRAAITLAVYILVGLSLVLTITRLRNALALYKTLSSKLEALVDQRTAERNRVWERSRELVAIIDRDDTILAANPALTRLLGADREGLTGTDFTAVLMDSDRDAYRAARDADERVFEARVDGAFAVSRVAWSRTSEDDRSYLIGRDFTAEYDCGEMLRQSQKMELVGQLTGGLAHDFGNLLPPISMTLHLLAKRHAEDARTRELITIAEESTERAGQLIRRLLELSRPGRLNPTVRSVDSLLQEMAPLLRQVMGDRELVLDVASSLPEIRVDANQLDMALLNLALNARDATQAHGTIVLEAKPHGEYVAITLADDGSGMDAETLARAMEPFFSTKKSGEGSGLGLPMVHNFSVAAGGSFALESRPDEGTRATLKLPVACQGSNSQVGSTEVPFPDGTSASARKPKDG